MNRSPECIARRKAELRTPYKHPHMVTAGRNTEPYVPQMECKVCCDITDRREFPKCSSCGKSWEPEEPPGLAYIESLQRPDQWVLPD